MKTTFLKRLALPIAMALMSFGSFAATSGVTLLFSNGQKVSFAFAFQPEIKVTSDGLSISSSATSTVSYSFADVLKFYFEDDIETGISQVEVQRPVFSYVDGVVTVSGIAVDERLEVVSLSGSQIGITKADSAGKARIDLRSTPTGVYVVSTSNGVSFKLLKK